MITEKDVLIQRRLKRIRRFAGLVEHYKTNDPMKLHSLIIRAWVMSIEVMSIANQPSPNYAKGGICNGGISHVYQSSISDFQL